MSAFSSFEWRALWGRGRCGRLQPAVPRPGLRAAAPGCARTYLFPERVQEEALELREALVDSRPAPLLHGRLGGLQVGPRAVAESRVRPSVPPAPPARARPGPTFRCAAALRGRFGVRLALAGAAARGEVRGFPGASAGMVSPAPERGCGCGSHRLRARGRPRCLKQRPRGCVNPAPRSFPRSRQPMSGRPALPPAPPAARPLSVTRPLRPADPRGTKGSWAPSRARLRPLRDRRETAVLPAASGAPAGGPLGARLRTRAESRGPPSPEREILEGNRVRGQANLDQQTLPSPPGLEPPHSRVSAPGTPPPAAPTKDP